MFSLVPLGCAGSQAGEDGPIGQWGRSDEPEPGVLKAVPSGDASAIARRGRLLFDSERALALGYEQGPRRVAPPKDNAVFPLVDIDPGGGSGQVMFLRWTPEDMPDRSKLDPLKAQRWLLVSMVLSPDSFLDRELLAGYLERTDAEYDRVVSAIAAVRAVAKAEPGRVFHVYPVIERVQLGKGGGYTLLPRVYLLADDGGPDLEVTLEPVPKHDLPAVNEIVRVHEPGDVGAQIQAQTQELSPVSVARAMLQGGDAVRVQVKGGSAYVVEPRTGRVRVATDEDVPASDPPSQPNNEST